jgi:predicted dienelactone hydrolase
MRSLSSLRTLALLALCVAGGSPSARASDAIGVRMMSVSTPERGATLPLTVWYPAGSGGKPERVGANSVFVGVSALRDAAMADGVFPVVVVAHGGLRAAPNQSGWISARLAERGYIVAAVQPPVLTSGEAARAVAEIGLRPADLSAALSVVENDPSIQPHANMEKVGALGFFLGGASSLALAGARLDPERYRRLCDGPGGPDCAWFAKAGVDLRQVDVAPLIRSHRDSRLRTAVVIDPELSGSFSWDGLAEITAPITIINLGARGETPPWLEAAELGAAAPTARYVRLPGANAFSLFGVCTPRGAAILRAEGEDEALCQDSGGVSREDRHAQLAAMIAAALLRGFSALP